MNACLCFLAKANLALRTSFSCSSEEEFLVLGGEFKSILWGLFKFWFVRLGFFFGWVVLCFFPSPLPQRAYSDLPWPMPSLGCKPHN